LFDEHRAQNTIQEKRVIIAYSPTHFNYYE